MTHLCHLPPPDIDRRPGFSETPPTAAEPDRLADWIEAQAVGFQAQRTRAGRWMAETMRELAATARFLGATTPEQYEARKQTLERERLFVRPRPKVAGRYQAWDVVDGRGKVVRACTDLFDAMMWIQQRFVAPTQPRPLQD